MRLAIFGASGPTGRLAVREALSQGAVVTAVTRNPDGFALQRNLCVRGGDVRDAADVHAAVQGQDAVICVVGVHYTRQPVDTYSKAAQHISTAMEKGPAQRLVCVTSMGADGRDASPDEPFIIRRVVAPVLHRLGRTIYHDMARMESTLRRSPLDWLVVRPSGLFDSEQVSGYRVSAERLNGMFTSRADLAHFLVAQALRPSYHRTAVDLVTRENTPRYRTCSFERPSASTRRRRSASPL